MNSVFRTWKFWVQFSGLKFWGRDLEKIKEKIKTVSKFLNCPNRSQVSERVLGRYFRKKKHSCPVFHRGSSLRKISKKSKNFENSKKAQNIPKSVQTCFKHVLGQFVPTIFCPVFHGGSSLRKLSKKSKKFQNSKNASNRFQKCPHVFWKCFGAIYPNFFLPSVPCRAFQIFWT